MLIIQGFLWTFKREITKLFHLMEEIVLLVGTLSELLLIQEMLQVSD
jgi:hypothetical protein